MQHPFLARLEQGPLLADGAMGTQLFARGIRSDQCLDAINLSQPDLVQQVHREYIAVGAELIETNTFGANRIRLAPFGLEDRVGEINRQGARIAREARDIMGESVFIAGAIGPSGALFQPLGPVAYSEVADAVQEQVEALAEKGVDILVFETFTDLNELTISVTAAQRVCDLPIVAQMSFDDNRRTASGHDVVQVVQALERLNVAVIGVNCGIGPQQALDLVGQLSHATEMLIAAMPNAGYPERVAGRISYIATPTYFANFARGALAAGARLIGGCCGTTPDHITAMRDVIHAGEPNRPVVVVTPRPVPATTPAPDDQPPPTRLARKLANREFVISVELDPPRGSNPSKALKGAALLRDAGVDLINIGDNVMAKVRMSSLGLALLIQQHVGIETLIHFSPRDRNLMAVQSDLLGAHALGIRHVLAVTGDQLRASTNPPVTAVWDVDSIGLIGVLKRMNQGTDYAGTSIGRPTRFLIGCAVGPNASDLDHELERLRRKLDAGADFVMTQPLFSMEQLERFLDRVGSLPVPLILGIVPLESFRQAELLHHEVPGFSVPDEVRDRMRLSGDHGAMEGLKIADEFVEQARGLVSGIYIMTSYGRYDAAITLTRRLAALSRTEEAS